MNVSVCLSVCLSTSLVLVFLCWVQNKRSEFVAYGKGRKRKKYCPSRADTHTHTQDRHSRRENGEQKLVVVYRIDRWAVLGGGGQRTMGPEENAACGKRKC
jgi:hypothetical protein